MILRQVFSKMDINFEMMYYTIYFCSRSPHVIEAYDSYEAGTQILMWQWSIFVAHAGSCVKHEKKQLGAEERQPLRLEI